MRHGKQNKSTLSKHNTAFIFLKPKREPKTILGYTQIINVIRGKDSNIKTEEDKTVGRLF